MGGTLALPIDERAALANTLLDTLESTNESVSIKEAWDAEVARRIEDLKAGSNRPLGRTASRAFGHGE
jgi:putative addiction module component (TIGR02574 family)